MKVSTLWVITISAVVDAVDRYGSQFSSSRTYLSAPDYAAVEHTLVELFGRPVVVTPSTTLGHLAALPTLIGERNALLLDHQAHHSVHTAATLVRAQGSTVGLVPHNRMAALEKEGHRPGPHPPAGLVCRGWTVQHVRRLRAGRGAGRVHHGA